ncbi:hypothetical protein BP6252_13151 [Coleophoma cylindrospora]|uniref:Uncharacterized protein n=1 Tax=Coleophoma cylindrospora TaxID=1849047 RepID=A0A3D8QA11_9HELO|nr:hypothetical protein BP6252_13151 [Coleophoma cylindrospora]
MNSTSSIYQGVWIDWSHGAILGTTLTLTKAHGAILIAALAFWVTAATSGFWSIAKFTIHQLRASREEKSKRHDGLYRQQQAILRNSSSPLSATWEILRLSWTWRRAEVSGFIRSAHLTLLAFLVFSFFLAATILTSRVQNSAFNNVDVLIVSPNCGGVYMRDGASSASRLLRVMSQTLSASNWARNCYGDQNNLQCGTYAAKEIPWTVNANASCPFANETCRLGATTAYDMDTGLVDSHSILGINAPPSQRLFFRRKAVCTPMRLGNYSFYENFTYSDDAPPDRVVRLYLGAYAGVNYTYEYNTHDYSESGYTTVSSHQGDNSSTNWIPIAPLYRDDADISFMFLTASSVRYSQPVDDPLFSAHTMDNTTVPGSVYYFADYWVSTIGCIDQYQYCKPAEDGGAEPICTELTSNIKSVNALSTLGLSAFQLATADHIAWNMGYSNIEYSISGRGSSALLAKESLFDLAQFDLPNNQWQIELGNWFNTSLARIQQDVVAFSAGPTNLGPDGLIALASTPMERLVCHSQKVRDGNYSNFSMLGIFIIATVGTVIIVLGLTIDLGVGELKRYLKKGTYSRISWALDEKLQLQRMAYEGSGWRSWTGGTDVVPVMTTAHDLGIYDIRDTKHPSIMPRTSQNPEGVEFLNHYINLDNKGAVE